MRSFLTGLYFIFMVLAFAFAGCVFGYSAWNATGFIAFVGFFLFGICFLAVAIFCAMIGEAMDMYTEWLDNKEYKEGWTKISS